MNLWNAIIRAEHRVERWLGLTPPPDPVDDGGASATGPTMAMRAASAGSDPIVGPAFPWLGSWTPAERQALLAAEQTLGFDPRVGGLLAVFDHESGGRPDVPIAATGTPRGGLIQLTAGANLDGFRTADDVWAIRQMSIADQLSRIVVPFYQRMFPHGATVQDGVALLRRNFLPALASQGGSYVLGVKQGSSGPNGETAEDRIAGGLSRGAIYAANPGFDRGGRGYFTWSDVDAQAQASVARGHGGLMRVSGAIVPPGDPALAGAGGPAELGGVGYDPINWIEVDAGNGYRVKMNADALSVGGIARPMSFGELIATARANNAIPLTQALADARYAAAGDKRIVNPVPSADGAHFNDAAQNAAFWANYAPLATTVLRDGGHKEMIIGRNLVPTGPGSMIFYGWRKPGGGMYQQGLRSDHNRAWIEYDQYGDLVRRDATLNGQPVDLLVEIQKEGNPLTAPPRGIDPKTGQPYPPVPAFLVAELGGMAGPLASIPILSALRFG